MSADDLARFHRGDLSFFDRLVRELSPRLLCLLRAFAPDPDDAADLLQDTWTRAFEQRHSFRGDGSLLGWLAAIGRNLALARRRRSGLAPRVPIDATICSAALRAAGASPFDEAAAEERRRKLREAVLELPDRQRDVIILRVLEDRTTRETAESLGCAEGTVKATLNRALRKLEARLHEWKP
ncbi:MAG: RNA polymerase sigma factor [Longimicrobiales bacterium]